MEGPLEVTVGQSQGTIPETYDSIQLLLNNKILKIPVIASYLFADIVFKNLPIQQEI